MAVIEKSWNFFLREDIQNDEIELFRKHERTGKPIGTPAFIEDIEQLLNRNFKPQKPGPKNKVQ